MKLKRLVLYLGLFLIGLSACLERIDFESPESIKNGIAIQGKLIKGNPSKVEVSIRKTFDFNSNPRFLVAKEVLIIDEEGNELRLKTRAAGKYKLEIPNNHSFFKVEYGKGYKIKVINLGEQNYESDFDYIFPVPKPKKLIAKVIRRNILGRKGKINKIEQLSFFIDTPLNLPNNSVNSRILWEFDGIYKITDTPGIGTCSVKIDSEPKSCYVASAPAKNYITSNPRDLILDSLGYKLYDVPFTRLFAEGYYLEVLQQALSETAYDYWTKVSLVVNRTGDVFQEPAGKINSNIKNINDPTDEVFGYFFATEAEILRVYVSPEMAKNPHNQCPEVSMSGDSADYCCSCLELKRSTAIKPVWWIE